MCVGDGGGSLRSVESGWGDGEILGGSGGA